MAHAAKRRAPREQTISERKLAANQLNALKSTGPKTVSGKERSRWNAAKHGLLARQVVIREYENQSAFTRLFNTLRSELKPLGIIEEMLVERIVYCYWNLARIAMLQRLHTSDWLKREKELQSLQFWPSVVRIFFFANKETEEELPQLDEDEFVHLTKSILVTSGVCDVETARAMPYSEAMHLAREKVMEPYLKNTDKPKEEDQRASDILHGIPAIDVLQRYETALEKRFYKALHELERLQRLKGGHLVPPPLILESN